MTRNFRAGSLGLLLVSSVVALAACGSGDNGGAAAGSGSGGRSPIALVADTFGSEHAVRSGKLDIGLTLTAKGVQELSKPVNLRLTGPFEAVDGALPRFDLDLAVDAAGQKLSVGAVSDSRQLWLVMSGHAYVVPESSMAQVRKALRDAQSKAGGNGDATALSSLGIDPRDWLESPRTVGDEEVGGVDTTHITANVDVAKVLTDFSRLLGKAGTLGAGAAGADSYTNLPTKLSAQDRKDIEDSITTAKVDVWTGKDDTTLRRIRLELGFDVPASASARAGGLQSGSLTFSMTISDLNKHQVVLPPKDALPLSQLQPVMSGLLGNA